MVLKRVQNMLNSRFPGSSAEDIPDQDSPEANATRGVRLFCESGGPNNAAEEVQYLPDIVTAAESSPQAAQACAYQIRKFLAKGYNSKPHIQYNAVMLIRILADNPGPTFTRNMDSKFIDVVKETLRTSKDPSVQQIMRETLHALERDKAYDTNLNPLFAMWRKEQMPPGMSPRTLNAPQWHSQMAGGFAQPQPSRSPQPQPQTLPSPSELSARVEEARTSAKLLLQLIQSTPAAEVDSNELIKEFGERCQQAQRSMQIYINTATSSSSGDDETLLTLIETNEQLSLALTKHQRAMLSARRSHSSTNVYRDSQEQQTHTGPTTATGSVYSQSGSVSPSATYSSSPFASMGTGAPPPPHLQASLANRYTSDSNEQRQPQPQPQTQAPGTLPQIPTSGRSTPLMDPTKTAYGPDPSVDRDDDPFADVHSAQYGGSGGSGAHQPSTMSAYFARQESAGNHATMHGGAQAFSPVDEQQQQYSYGYGRGTGLPMGDDVSPVEETRRSANGANGAANAAGEVRYRY
ncbi:hypothetical protein IWX49DRAFT_396360 [Phyllosticta citricarpa]|uniref:GAT domain-containing protein n=2 Tax=Phyllosticta TaxID=121621 RepID=A0ABR1MG80_9PEZI